MPVPACRNGRARAGRLRARRGLLGGDVNPRARRSPLEVGVHPRAGRSPLEGGVCPRAKQSLLEGIFEWAALVGRRGHRGVGHAPCACLSEMCLVLAFCRFYVGFPPLFKGTPRAVPDSSPRASAGSLARLPQMLKPTDRTSFPPGLRMLSVGPRQRTRGSSP
jgi:hypothetical protein